MAPDRPVSRPHGSGSASRPASPFPIGWFPSLTRPDRPVARLRCSGSPGCPDSPAPRAARRCQAPALNTGFPAFPASPGEAPGWCPFPAVNAFLRPSRPSRKSRREFILTFFRIHTLSTEFSRLSARSNGYPLPYAQLIHKLPGVTRRDLPAVALGNRPVFSGDMRLIANSDPPPLSSVSTPPL
jgi:hypothetical protein